MRLIQIIIFIISIFIVSLSASSQTSRSYMEKEIVGQSVQSLISEVPQHAGTWVVWDASGDNIIMMDGTKWKKSKSLDGNVHYRYVGTNGQPERFTQYIEAIFNTDFSKMNVSYTFGPIGMSIQMVGKYSCLGDGKQLAEKWINMPDEE